MTDTNRPTLDSCATYGKRCPDLLAGDVIYSRHADGGRYYLVRTDAEPSESAADAELEAG